MCVVYIVKILLLVSAAYFNHFYIVKILLLVSAAYFNHFYIFLCAKIIYPNPLFEICLATFRLRVLTFSLVQVIAKDLYFL
jgi:hypothetical protein